MGRWLKNLQPKAHVLLSTSGGLAYYDLPLLSVSAQKHQHTHSTQRTSQHGNSMLSSNK